METTKKRILIFVPEFPVLSETFIEREIAKLASFEELDVTAISLKKGIGTKSGNIGYKVIYAHLSPVDLVTGFILILKNPNLFSELVKISINNKNRCFMDSVYLLLKSYAYTGRFSKLKPYHIHSHFLSEPSTLVYFISRISKIPFSISAHARDVFGQNDKKCLNAELVSEKAKSANFIVVCNTKAYLKCLELAGDENKHKVMLHYHGVDSEIFKNVNANDIEDMERPFIFSVGRLEEKKGYKYLIDAVKILKERGISFVLKIAGPGKLYEDLIKQINENDLADRVSILGEGKGISNDLVLKYLSKATVFVLPSIETSDKDAEGIPNTLVEAGFMKKAILTTNTGSITELIAPNENGIIVSQKSDVALADALEKLIIDNDLRDRLGAKAYETVMEKFDLNKNIIELKNLLAK